MALNLCFEIPQAVPMRGRIEIDFGDSHGAKHIRLRQHVAVVIEDAGDHPLVLGRIGVGAADDVNVVFAGACSGQHGIAAPHGPGNDFSPMDGQSAGHFGEEAIVANHHTDFAKARVKHRVVMPRSDACLDLAAR